MSWSCSFPNRKAFEEKNSSPPPPTDGPAKEQFDVAHDVASKIIESGCVGGEGKEFGIYLSGHANEGHEPSPRYANDTVSVSVSQITPQPQSNR
jgi:hypothetical protein